MTIKKLSKDVEKTAKAIMKAQSKEGADIAKPLTDIANQLEKIKGRLASQDKKNQDFIRTTFSPSRVEDLKKAAEISTENKIVSARE